MDLNRIYYFVTVVESGSYTSAGERLKMPKSTLSRHIKALEDDLEVRLLNRSTRKISLTKSGEAFYKNCLPLVTHLQNVHSEMADERAQVSGQLRVTLSGEFALIFLSTVLADFMKKYPKIFLDFEMSPQNHDLIQSGFDLALRIGNLEDSSYIARRINTMDVCLYAAPGYLNKQGRLLSIEDLANHQLIMLGGLDRQSFWFGESLASKLNSQLNTNNVIFNRQMAEQGLGIAMLPAPVAQSAVIKGLLEPVLPDQFRVETPLYAVYPSRNHPTKAMLAFIDFVSTELAKYATKLR